MYTLENHLHQACVENPAFEILNSIWQLNKKNLPSAQNAINFNFPHYSLHESSHSDTIIKNIESFLGTERIKQLSPTDAWLILMSTYTHDLGMVIYHSVLEEKWGSDEFQAYLSELSKSSSDKDLKEAAYLLINLKEEVSLDKNRTLPLDIRRAVVLVTSDYYRVKHYVRSKEMILGNDKEFYSHVKKFNLDNIPNRFSEILSDIAYGHGVGFYEAIDRLEFIADGFGNDKMHPRFIACLLRLGDLLDVDDNRFSIFNEKILANDLPYTSQLHKEKHASIKHLLISPDSIEITVDCQTDEVYRIARQWFDWLQEEVEDQSREWVNIAPSNLSGMSPVISRGKIKILYQSNRPVEDLMNLRFTISNKKIFEIIEGGAIYDNAGFVFLREIVQNAIDATKIQLWKTVSTGVYDYLIKSHKKLGIEASHDSVMSFIKFPDDLPSEIWQNFLIELNINWKDKNKKILQVDLIDKGCGISVNSLIRMTKMVGESRKMDSEYKNIIESMPYWLKPTGAFGIGIQSIFLVTDSFIIQTKAESEDSREIVFYSAKNGDYCRVTPNKPKMATGTKITVEILKDSFFEIFPSTFSFDIVERFDFFNDKYDAMSIYSLENYIKNEFLNINNLRVNLMNNLIINKKNDDARFKTFSIVEKKDVLLTLKEDTHSKNRNLYVVDENFEVGSSLTIEFYRGFIENSGGSRYERPPNFNKSGYFVRGIPVSDDFPMYFIFQYCSILWDFQSPESDKILKLSRDKFVPKTRQIFNNKLVTKIFPKIIAYIIEAFKNRIEGLEKNFEVECFHIEMTYRMIFNNNSDLLPIYNSSKIPLDFVTDLNFNEASYGDFFSAKKMIFFTYKDNSDAIFYDGQKELLNNLKKSKEFIKIVANDKPNLIIWKTEYFHPYFTRSKYQLIKFYTLTVESGVYNIQILEYSDHLLPVYSNELGKQRVLGKSDSSYSDSKRRELIYPLQEYYRYLAVDQSFDSFEQIPRFCKHFIISPFPNYLSFKLVDTLQDKGLVEYKEIKKYLHENNLGDLIPESLVNFILENTSNPYKQEVTKDKILETYLELITEILSKPK